MRTSCLILPIRISRPKFPRGPYQAARPAPEVVHDLVHGSRRLDPIQDRFGLLFRGREKPEHLLEGPVPPEQPSAKPGHAAFDVREERAMAGIQGEAAPEPTSEARALDPRRPFDPQQATEGKTEVLDEDEVEGRAPWSAAVVLCQPLQVGNLRGHRMRELTKAVLQFAQVLRHKAAEIPLAVIRRIVGRAPGKQLADGIERARLHA